MYGFIYMVSRRDEQQRMENSYINKHILSNVLEQKKDYTNTMDMTDAYTQLHLLKIYVPYYKIQTTQQHFVCTLF